MSRVGILGGSFNPPTFAHLQLGVFAKDQFSLDRIIVVPCSVSGFYKDSKPISDFHRFNMSVLATENLDDFEVLGFELFKDRPVYAYETIEFLRLKNKKNELFYITGSDSIVTLPRWKKPEIIAENSSFVIAERDDVTFEESKDAIDSLGMNAESFKLEYPSNGLSSTLVRKRLNEGLSCNCLAPQTVLEYVMLHDLYK